MNRSSKATLPHDVVARVDREFAVAGSPAVLAELEALAGELGDRVVRAVLVLAGGSADRLRHFTRAARGDPRDVLYWAEYDACGRRIRDCSATFPEDD